ncbi:hypothetical protein EG19_04605 [Thermoanaerobaculum aquaticum]|uniref:Histone deacetylase domain-containing protein n=1 Tax=Thermoanaerobaculum aquaticum TaxID=1312852 RepID=A0A062XRQ4_9BACT|nr:hypothetical protein EG19_04605 [Thermoanaerobaculum aquaticum]
MVGYCAPNLRFFGFQCTEWSAGNGLLLVGGGFDAHELDPLGGLAVTTASFAQIGELLAEAAAGKPLLAVLEGGYHLKALEDSVAAFLSALLGGEAPKA